MKFKYYIRGFGTGVLFATVLLMITLAVKDNMPSDKRKQTNSSGNLVIDDVTKQNGTMELNNTTEQNDTTEPDSTAEQNDTTEPDSTAEQNDTTEPDSTPGQNSTTDQNNNTTSQQGVSSQENTATQAATDSSEPVVPTTEPSSGSEIIFTLSITPGMTSNEAADILASYGIVESGYDFNMYLYKNGYESRLRVGNYQIKAGMSYKEIAEIITR